MKSTEVQKIILCNFNNFIWSVSSTTWSWHWYAVLNYWCRPDMTTQRMPSYVRSTHSVWHIPSKSLVTCDTLTWWPIRGQHPGHVTSGQPIRGRECDLGQCIIRGVKYLISDQADNDIVCQSGIRGHRGGHICTALRHSKVSRILYQTRRSILGSDGVMKSDCSLSAL